MALKARDFSLDNIFPRFFSKWCSFRTDRIFFCFFLLPVPHPEIYIESLLMWLGLILLIFSIRGSFWELKAAWRHLSHIIGFICSLIRINESHHLPVLFSRELLALNYSETYYSTKGEEITTHPQITVSYRIFLCLFFENIISLHNFETILALQVVAESVTSESESCRKC